MHTNLLLFNPILVWYVPVYWTLQEKKTCLHHAALRGHVEVVEILIRLGADVNALDNVS